MKKLLLTLLGILIALPSFARDFQYTYEGQTLYYTVLDEVAKTVETRQADRSTGNDVSGKLIIPETVKNDGTEYAVISIGESTFSNCSGLTEVTIPGSVTSIGKSAFVKCSGLTEISIPESVISIGRTAFGDCRGLIKAEFASVESLCSINFESNTANPLFYAKNLYINGKEVTKLEIPNTVTSIGQCAFYNCTGLTEITIPSSVTSIGVSAWYGCNSLMSVYCTGAAPASARSNIFSSDVYDNATLYVPEQFQNEYKETDPWKSFSKIVGIQVETDTFRYEYEGVMLNYTVIDRDAKTCEVTKLTYPDSFSGHLTIPSEAMNGGVPYTVIAIGDSAFSRCINLTTISLPNTLKTIGIGSFGQCENLTSIDIPNSVESIGGMAFYRNIKLQEITLGNSLKSIGEMTFYMCPIETIEIPNSLTELSNSIFSGCTKLKSVKLHNDISAIGERAFSGCSSLSSIEIPGSVKSIGSNAFSWCALDEITCLIQEPGAVTYGENIFLSETIYTNAVLSVPEGSVDKYKETDPWKNFSHIEALPTSGIEEVSVDLDMSLPYTVYDLNGVKVSDSIESLSTGIYVVCQGKKVMKLAIK